MARIHTLEGDIKRKHKGEDFRQGFEVDVDKGVETEVNVGGP